MRQMFRFSNWRFAGAVIALVCMGGPLGLTQAAQAKGADSCTGTLADGTYKDVVVPRGASCSIGADVSITHDLDVGAGATLVLTGATVGHDLRASAPAGIGISGAQVGHDVTITGTTGAGPGRYSGNNYICGTAVGHDLIVADSAKGAGPWNLGTPPECDAPNQVGHNATVYIDPALLAAAKADGKANFDVIVQGTVGADVPAVLGQVIKGRDLGFRALDSAGGGAVRLTGKQILSLAHTDGLAAITEDTPVQVAGGPKKEPPPKGGSQLSSTQLWPFASGVARGWVDAAGSLRTPPAIAIVDSGIDEKRADFGGRVVDSVSIATGRGNSKGDGYGHGTFVAGIAAGAAAGYAGAAPTAPIVSIDVLDDQGRALTSDVIAACDWILANRIRANIRVANFSLTSTAPASVFWDPLDRAVEALWLNGITVVAAAGNYATGGAESGVLYAPGNDPFVLTVGAADLHDTVSAGDDTAAPWSAWGYTIDGFAKPELGAPGRYLIGPVPDGSTLAKTRPEAMVGKSFIQLSGTSFAAPVVAGTAAYLLALHPDWTPDQVKGAILHSARATASATPRSLGVGLVDAAAAAAEQNPPNPNLALNRFLVPDPKGGRAPVFDTASWQSAALSDPSWASAAWGSAAWGSAAWGSAAWGSAAWGSAAWGSAAWGSAAWGSAAWGSAAWGSAAWGSAVADNASSDAGRSAPLDSRQAAAASAQLGLQVNPDGTVRLP